MGIKYTLFLITCVAVTVLVTLEAGPYLLAYRSENSQPALRQADIILEQLADIRTTLDRIEKQQGVGKRTAVPKTAKASIRGRPTLGNSDAKVTVVEFTDYQCPYCSRFEKTTFKKLKENYIDTGKVRWVVLDTPLGFHKEAMFAAIAVHCAGEQGKLWELRELLYQNQKKLQRENIAEYASQLEIETGEFDICLDSGRYDESIKQDMAEAKKQRISGTPTFIIAKSSPDVVSGKRIVGAQAYEKFGSEIDKLLNVK